LLFAASQDVKFVEVSTGIHARKCKELPSKDAQITTRRGDISTGRLMPVQTRYECFVATIAGDRKKLKRIRAS
jgi:hypothetical protein